VHREDHRGSTLLHKAVGRRSPEFCKLLIEMSPNLARAVDNSGGLPFHLACSGKNFETAKYLYDIYPNSINIPNDRGDYPLHTFMSTIRNNETENAIKTVKFLLQYDVGAVSRSNTDGDLPLHIACRWFALDIVKLVFDAYPEAIHVSDNGDRFYHPMTPLEIARIRNPRTDASRFFQLQIDLERQAREDRTPDNHGRLPIHRAVRNRDTAVGAIKLMLAANPSSISMTDNQGCSLLHIACQGGNIDIVNYLIGIDPDSLSVPDQAGNLPLHHACLGGSCGVIPLIIEQSTFGVTLQNSHKQTPVEYLLFESECNRDSREYVEAVRCLFQVNPADILKCLTSKDEDKSTTNNCLDQCSDLKRKRV